MVRVGARSYYRPALAFARRVARKHADARCEMYHEGLAIKRIAVGITLPVEEGFVLRSLRSMKMGLQATTGEAQSLGRVL